MFISPTFGCMEIKGVCDRILAFYDSHKKYETPIQIVVGTDSQNFSDTKVVTVIAVTCEGHGGIFFYDVTHILRVDDVRTKLHMETQESLKTAEELVDVLGGNEKYEEMYFSCPIAIHVDAGNSPKGKTKELIPELVGWIKACGYDCCVKPDSFVSSSIANRISK